MERPSCPQPGAHERICDAAYKLFTERGIDGTTTREIAAEAGVNEVTLFRHFGNKDGLVRAVIERYIAIDAVPQLDQIPRSDDLRADLLKLTLQMIQFHTEQQDFFRFVFANIVQHPEHGDFFKALHEQMLGFWGRFFEPYCRAQGLDVTAVALHYISPIVMRSIRHAFLDDPLIDDTTFAETHATMMANALLRDKESTS